MRREKMLAQMQRVEANPPAQGVAVAAFEEHRNCCIDRFNRAVERAAWFEEIGAENIVVFYDEYEDYIIVEFDLNGNHYYVRTYKIHCVTINGNEDFCSQLRFDTEFRMFDYFESGKHLQ